MKGNGKAILAVLAIIGLGILMILLLVNALDCAAVGGTYVKGFPWYACVGGGR